HIQHLRPGGDASRVEQRLDERCGSSREGRVVLHRRLLPAGRLEGPDGFEIESCHVAGYSIDQLARGLAVPDLSVNLVLLAVGLAQSVDREAGLLRGFDQYILAPGEVLERPPHL